MGANMNLGNDFGQQPEMQDNQNINQQNFINNENNLQGGDQFNIINNNQELTNQEEFINQEEFEEFKLQDLNQNLSTDEMLDNYESDILEDIEGDIGENDLGPDGNALNSNSEKSEDK